MNRELVFCCVQPNDLYYVWQVNMWLESCRNNGAFEQGEVHILIYKPDAHTQWNKNWEIVEKLYPEAKFFKYDDRGVRNLLRVYIPLLRPHTLSQHFKAFPELKNKAIFYHDCDIILNRKLDIEKYLNDDVNYVSDTVSLSDYMSHQYFESKRNQVIPEMLKEYDGRDVLGEAANIVGISKSLIVENYSNTGGAQYLLKNIDGKFWDDVQAHSFDIVLYLKLINRKYFTNEDSGYQSWCADMWAVLWGIWATGAKTKQAIEMEFCWSTDLKEKLLTHPILHNAGVTSEGTIRTTINDENGKKIEIEAPAFYKGRYHQGNISPFKDDEYTNNILNHPISSNYCFHHYLQEIKKIQNKYNLSY